MTQKFSPTLALLLVVIVPILGLGSGTVTAADEAYTLTGAVGIPGGFASADIVFADPVAGVLVMADRTNKSVDIVDLNIAGETTARQFIPTGANAFAGPVRQGCPPAVDNEISGPNGVVTVHHAEIWVTDAPHGTVSPCVGSTGGVFTPTTNSSVKVLALRTGAVLDSIDTGGNHRSDEVAVDPRHNLFIVANPADEPVPFVTLISTIPDKNGKHPIVKKILFDGTHGAPAVDPANGLEQPTWDPRSGNFFMAVPSFGLGAAAGEGGVVEISTHRRDDDDDQGKSSAAEDIKVVRTIVVPNCTPQGTALGPDDQLFLGCNAVGRVVVLNIRTGAQTGITGLKGGCDEVWFDRFSNHFLGACHQGVPAASPPPTAGPQVLGAIDADPIAFDSNVATNPSNHGGRIHALAADDFTGRVFVAAPRTAAGTNNDLSAAATPPANTNGCLLIFTPSALDSDDQKNEGGRDDR
jgi:hypothetical protein